MEEELLFWFRVNNRFSLAMYLLTFSVNVTGKIVNKNEL